ncbi:4-alpha-glucanotransferase [uncultured Roseobacter sp.]|uniref:4-alpha-glucanotransferase n=1 Tax=uncultured Roseobacter sp. TaxID=114847 RepID=UPI00260429B3|nr:4-alpha-glucanotransferase [uncultured Roseobacter sp.]
MTADRSLAALASFCGVFDRFLDLEGVMRPTSPDTQRALLRANGLDVGSEVAVRDTLAALQAEQEERLIPQEIVVTCDTPNVLRCEGTVDWHLTLEETTRPFAQGKCDGEIALPPLPAGVHHLHIQSGKLRQTTTVIAAPARTPSLQESARQERCWGVVAPLYGLQSRRNAGLGDFEDLAQLAEGLGAQGAGFLGINPVHALGWAAQDTISPYSPSHRGFLNTAHIALDRLPGLSDGAPPSNEDGPLIDYAAHSQTHRAALRTAFNQFQQSASDAEKEALTRFTQEGGAALEAFALFEDLSTRLGQDWRHWPEEKRTPEAARASGSASDASFHLWLQWVADHQLQEAQRRAQEEGMALGLYLDLAVGARLDGAEAWAAADTLAQGVSLGAPPDHLSPAGQNWQLAAYAPLKLAARNYQPLRQVLRQVLRHCGVLRLDHALGLNRSYWIPEDGSPGGYIRQPFQSLMALIAIEAQRAGVVIVGEDLGLVPDGFRDTMAAKGFYGYTVLQYEKTKAGRFRKAQDLRPQSLTCFGTHDTPTIRGFWTGCDIEWWHRLDWIDDAGQGKAQEERKAEKADLLGVPDAQLTQRDARDLRDKVHCDLAQGPAALVAVQLDDVLGVEEAQNLPGTIDAHPNWRRKIPVDVQEIATQDVMKKTAQIMANAGRSGLKAKTRKEFP